MWGTPYSIRQRNKWDVTRRTDTKESEAVDQIRRVRREIMPRGDFDPKRLIDSYKGHQKARAAKGPARPER